MCCSTSTQTSMFMLILVQKTSTSNQDNSHRWEICNTRTNGHICQWLCSWLNFILCWPLYARVQVNLVGYCHAFRYCPGGQHVEYREASRTAHEGTVEFISLDAHKGAGESLLCFTDTSPQKLKHSTLHDTSPYKRQQTARFNFFSVGGTPALLPHSICLQRRHAHTVQAS